MGRVDVLMHQPQRLALFYDQWCRKEPNLQVLLNTEIIGCESHIDKISMVKLCCRGLLWDLSPSVVVDASGDAVIASLARHAYDETPIEHLQRPAYIVSLIGVAADMLEGDGPLKITGALVRAIKDGALPAEAAGAHFRSSASPGEVFLTLDLPGDRPALPYNGWEPSSLTWVEMQGREIVFAIVDHLRSVLEGFASARVSALPACAGIRESRRWLGEVVLTEQDILESRTDVRAVANATWPIELRETARGPRLLYPQEPKACGIPLGALRARDLRNVFIAGRCISATHRAQASTRVMGTALATGQAAGIAATFPEQDTGKLALQVQSILSQLESAK